MVIGDTIQFRLLQILVMDTYAQTPTLTVKASFLFLPISPAYMNMLAR